LYNSYALLYFKALYIVYSMSSGNNKCDRRSTKRKTILKIDAVLTASVNVAKKLIKVRSIGGK